MQGSRGWNEKLLQPRSFLTFRLPLCRAGIVQTDLDVFKQGVAREVPGFVLLDAIDQFDEFVY